MSMRTLLASLAGAAALSLTVPAAHADGLSDVEGARAKERSGYGLSRQDREKLRRHGRTAGYRSYGWRGDEYDGYGYGYDGLGFGVYVGPRYRYRGDGYGYGYSPYYD
jgi:hypothetical protein